MTDDTFRSGGMTFETKTSDFSDPAACLRPKREQVLSTAAGLISGDRRQSYGDAGEDLTRTGKMWAAVLGLDEITAEQVALCMALVKIGRLCHTPNHEDSWVDICGYAALGAEIASTPGRYV